jgi:predicted nucleic acid-binding protein
MPIADRFVYDTTVYIAAIHGGLNSAAFRALQDTLPRTHLASIVSAELRAGATNDRARRAVHQFTRWAHRVGRVVTPTATSWQRAGDVLSAGHGRTLRPSRRVTVGIHRDGLVAREVDARLHHPRPEEGRSHVDEKWRRASRGAGGYMAGW